MKFSFAERIICIFLITCAYIIATLEICGLLNQLNRPITVIFIQLLILLIAGFIVYLLGIGLPNKLNFEQIIAKGSEIIQYFKNNKIILLFALGIILVYIFQLILSMKFPQNTSDALYNHLSRIGYWLQQGSLQPYNGFTYYGSTFPYNNSLLMAWPVIFLRSDFLVGCVQFFSSIAISLTIYEFSMLFGFSKKSSILAGLTFLTFPIVVLQATTAQNDLLATAFVCAAFLFLMKFYHHGLMSRILFSSLSLGLAIGTKQYVFFTLPVFFILLIYYLVQKKKEIRRGLITWLVAIISCTLAFGMYTYLQNLLYYGSFFGPTYKTTTSESEFTNPRILLKKLPLNTARFFTQFISCEGLIYTYESKCLAIKKTILGYGFSKVNINVESDDFLAEKEQIFRIDIRYPLNEESAWYGITSWVLILPSVIIGSIYFIKKQKYDALILLFASLAHFFTTSVYKYGWDSYMGRYLIISIALIMPYTSHVFSFLDKKGFRRLILLLYSLLCLFVMSFSLVNNVSKPLISHRQFGKLASWGITHSPIVESFAYKLAPLANNSETIWELSENEIKTFGANYYKPPQYLVENFVPSEATLIIVAEKQMVMDYLFFGDGFSRKIIPVFDINLIPSNPSGEVFMLVSPDFENIEITDYRFVSEKQDWKLFQRIKN